MGIVAPVDPLDPLEPLEPPEPFEEPLELLLPVVWEVPAVQHDGVLGSLRGWGGDGCGARAEHAAGGERTEQGEEGQS